MSTPADTKAFAGRFDIIARHRGGMAGVLVLRDRATGRMVAAKTPLYAPERFDREARFWLALGEHPNIVRAHLVQRVEDAPYLFMEYLGEPDGTPRTLRQLLDANPGGLPRKRVAELGLHVLAALEHAQRAIPGFVHRDLKPENILVRPDGSFCVADFGIGFVRGDSAGEPSGAAAPANAEGVGGTFVTELGVGVGTPGYAAPEQVRGERSLTFQADLFALGRVLGEAAGFWPAPARHVREHAGTAALELPEPTPEIPSSAGELGALVRALTAIEPRERPPSLDEVARKLATDGAALPPSAPQMAPTVDELLNRAESLVSLGNPGAARRVVEELLRKAPWSNDVARLARESGVPLRRIVALDLQRPLRVLAALALATALVFGMVHLLGITEGARLSVLGCILLAEVYINRRTAMTYDVISYPTALLGIALSIYYDVTNRPMIGGHVGGHLLGLAAAFAFGFALFLRGLFAGGTTKLLAATGAFLGLWALLAAALVLAQYIALDFALLRRARWGHVVWDGDTLRPAAFSRGTEVPFSWFIFFAFIATTVVASIYR